MSLTRRALLGASLALPALAARAQGFPDRPLRLIVPYAAGGSADASARMLAEAMAAPLGQPVVVENRPGGGATIGAQAVARAAPDGLTLLYGTPAPQIINPHLMRSVPYDPVRDFAPVSGYKRAPNLLAIHPSVPARSLAELIALAKARPGTLTFASSGVGSSSHLAGEMLKFMAQIDITHVPYRGTSAALTDLLGGTVSMALDTLSILLPQAQGGKLRALGVTTPQRSAKAPALPAIAETLPGFDAAPFNYIAATGGTPAPIVAKLNQVIVAILRRPDFVARMEALGEEATPSTPEELVATLRAESARWKQVIEAAGIRVE
ncbi:Bug family tripartite tricarboxylate transporter substrate binding protein [Falsiroseomonas selenitidurans]|uniref:Tripartite tricarboxylate transporter substrate binding protein n=1 Tax=Falsiroseomonas selenitidurans TaxID=2716335 RepID=A0ABX1E006_9PROT|nr:tripartite tricarboxylate transporter substrate binding protein [Falsiroseomonas selenitidurans]NKC30485.1 tripartite tricarboxylate transporter substrate binding protein [Falsiroseomonas selenitidurans]